MRQVAGIFLQTVRAGLRMRGFWLLVALLVATAIGLPRGLRGDGTVAGSYDVIVRYTLGIGAFALGLGAAAAGAGTRAGGRRSGVLALTLVKPVRGAALFVGKWLGVLALSGALLALAHVLVLLPLHFGTAEDGERYASRMVSREVVGATLNDAREVARAELERRRRAGTLPKDVPERVVLRDLTRQIEQAYDVVGSGETIEWRFDAGRRLRKGEEMGLRLTLDQQWGLMGAARGIVAIRPAGAEEWAGEMLVEGAVLQEIEVPFEGWSPAGHSAFEARFTNAGAEDSEPVLIHPKRGVALLIYGKSFWANAARAYAAQLALIAVFAALGVMLGGAFSMPVAAFVAAVLYVLAMISPALKEEAMDDEGEERGFVFRAGQEITLVLEKGFSWLLAPEPLTKLTRGEKIPSAMLGRSLWIGLVGFPLLAMLGLGGILRLRASQEE